MGKRPKEDPNEVAERQRQLRLANVERTAATEAQASGLTSDLRAMYGTGRMPSMFSGAAAAPASTPAPSYGAGLSLMKQLQQAVRKDR